MCLRFMLIKTITFDFDDKFEAVLSVWFASTARHSGIKVLLAVIRQSRFVTLHSIIILIIIRVITMLLIIIVVIIIITTIVCLFDLIMAD